MVDTQKKIIVILPSKVGSTSLKNCLLYNGFKNSEYKVDSIPYLHNTLSELINFHGVDISELGEYKIIQLTRDPYYRFVSSYFHQMRILNKFINFDVFLQQVLDNFKYLRNDEDSFYKSFYGDINYKRLAYQSGNFGGLRFYYLQSWWNDIGVNVKYFKLEDIVISLKSLNDYLDMNIEEFPHNNKNYIHLLNKSEYDIILTEERKQTIKSIYNKDFINLNY